MKQPSGIVLIVDDDPSVRTSLQRLFSSVGLAAQGFESAEQFSAAAVPDIPGCLIVDVRLPGPSGLEFQDRLLRAGISIPIIFISGHGDVHIAPTERAKIEINGSGDVYLHKDPKSLDTEMHGSGRVHKAEAGG